MLWYVLIIVMWFNPLAWIAFELVQRDDELAVDEVAIERLGKDYKRKYGEILLSYARMNDSKKLNISLASNLNVPFTEIII